LRVIALLALTYPKAENHLPLSRETSNLKILDQVVGGVSPASVAKIHHSDGKTSDVRRIVLTVRAISIPWRGQEGIDQMLSIIVAIIIVLSICILAAHAFEAFRSD
jgi:hypothetical protein